MKITRVTGWSIKLPYVEGVYRMSGDRITTGMDAVVVRVTADDGSVGIGESGTVGVTFDAQNLPGQVAGLTALAPVLLGLDPSGPQSVYRRRGGGTAAAPALEG